MLRNDLNKEKQPIHPEEETGCDLMIIIGTALAVSPFNNTIMQAEIECPKVLINLENTAENGFDFMDLLENPERLFIPGKCDETIFRICKDLGWTNELYSLMGKPLPKEETKV